MTNRELFEKTLRFEEVPHPPFAVLGGQVWVCKRNGLSPEQLMKLPDAGAKITVEAYKECGSAIVYGGNQYGFYPITAMGGKVDNNIVGGAPEILQRPMQEPEDIDNFDADKIIAEMLASDYYAESVKQVKEIRKLVGDEYHISIGAYGPFTYASQMLGVDKFMELLFDDEDGYAEKMMRLAAEITLAWNRGMIEAGGDLVMMPEPVASGDLISPAMFEEYVLPIDREVLARTREFCPHVCIHICGRTDTRVAPLAEVGFSAFSVDSIDMVKASETAAGRMAMMGNLSPAGIVLGMDARGVYEESKKLCASMAGIRGFILAPGCDLPPDTPLENIQAMARAAEEA